MTKEELRKVYIKKRNALSDSEYQRLNKELFDVFFGSVGLSRVKVLHSFLPIQKNREPDTRAIINHITRKFNDVRIVVPRVEVDTQTIENIFLETSTVLQDNVWGIPEPEMGVIADPQEIDIALVPMVIFDSRGHRVGYGKGFYDKFISTLRPDCKRIGICLFDPVDRIDDIRDYDQPLTQCITPSGNHSF